MDLYQYETHLHTKEASACAQTSGVDHVRGYKGAGYTGIIVTDHFFNGNSCVPKNLPWAKRVDLLYRGYENAKEEGDRIGLSVFFGWESNYRGTEFLIYGLDNLWLKNHPEILSWSIEEQYQKVHASGGLVVHAHPFRACSYIPEVRLFPDQVDAVEAINFRNQSNEFNDKAIAYAEKYKLPIIAGTDAHGDENSHSGVAFGHKIKDIKDFIESIRTGGYELIRKESHT